ncbi:MAG TPA: response regulator transcription factor [Candidatus Limnocylindrales bacterium]|nr:response regulator transcription factor [Candidatus Limnocylindrales bacterium]
MPNPIRVLLVEDHQLVAEGMQALLSREADIQVVGVAGSVQDAVSMSSAGAPDVVVMDFRLPDGTGAQAGERMRSQRPRPRLVFVSGDDSEDALLSAVRVGACGFLPKSRASADMVEAVRRAAEGEMLIPAGRLAGLLTRVHQRAREEAERSRLRSQFTPREHEVLLMMAQGLDNKAIARELGLTLNTVRSYVQDVLEKLGAHSKLEAVAAAARQDLLVA